MMDRDKARQISDDIRHALASVAAKHGLTVAVTGGTFDSAGMFKPRIEFRAGDFRQAEFDKYARLFGLDARLFGKTFVSAGTEYRVTGIRTKSRARPVLAARVHDGKEFVFPIEALRGVAVEG